MPVAEEQGVRRGEQEEDEEDWCKEEKKKKQKGKTITAATMKTLLLHSRCHREKLLGVRRVAVR